MDSIQDLAGQKGIDLADSHFVSYSRVYDENKILFKINSWSSKLITVEFYDVIHFINYGTYWTVMLSEIEPTSEFLNQALIRCYGRVPKEHPYKLYRFWDADDAASFEVIARQVNIEIL